jgi:hypothetical protein
MSVGEKRAREPDAFFEEVFKHVQDPFVPTDPPLAGLDGLIKHIELRVRAEMTPKQRTVTFYFFDSNGEPMKPEVHRPDVTGTKLEFCVKLREWYVRECDRAYERGHDYEEDERLIHRQLGLVRAAIYAQWTKSHPDLPCCWSETNCGLEVHFPKDK